LGSSCGMGFRTRLHTHTSPAQPYQG
jgi:hypothetical protein